MTNYGPKKLYYVPAKVGQTNPNDPATGYSVNYVFESNQIPSTLNELGCIPITTPDQLKTLDAGSTASYYAAPKNRPRRATERTATGYNSGFHAQGVDLTGGTWLSGGFGAKKAAPAPPLFLISDPTHHSVSVYVELGTLKYAWNMSKARYQKIQGDFSALGISLCTEANRKEYIWGADAPKPAIYIKQETNGTTGDSNSFSAFVGRTKSATGDPIVISGGSVYNLRKQAVTLFSLLQNHKSFN